MGFTTEEGMVRVDFFKPSGKWYTTEAVKMDPEFWDDDSILIHDAFAIALEAHLRNENGSYRLSDMTAVCLEPYHEYSHPLMMRVQVALERTGHRTERKDG